MWTHRFALLLLLGSTAIGAAPPDAPVPADEIDVDAMARAKDVKAGGDAVAPAPAAGDEAAAAEAPAPAAEEATPAAAEAAEAPPSGEADATTGAAPDPAAATGVDPKPAAAATTDGPVQATDAAPAETGQRRLADACSARANALLDAAQKQDYEKATRDFDAKMRTALPATKFREAWESLAQFGAFKARGQSHPATQEGYIAVTIPLVFEKANLYAQVACGSDGRVAGFYVKPLQLPAR